MQPLAGLTEESFAGTQRSQTHTPAVAFALERHFDAGPDRVAIALPAFQFQGQECVVRGRVVSHEPDAWRGAVA